MYPSRSLPLELPELCRLAGTFPEGKHFVTFILPTRVPETSMLATRLGRKSASHPLLVRPTRSELDAPLVPGGVSYPDARQRAPLTPAGCEAPPVTDRARVPLLDAPSGQHAASRLCTTSADCTPVQIWPPEEKRDDSCNAERGERSPRPDLWAWGVRGRRFAGSLTHAAPFPLTPHGRPAHHDPSTSTKTHRWGTAG